MKILVVLVSLIISFFVIRAMLVFYDATIRLGSGDVYFFMSLTVFVVFVLAGLIISVDLHHDSMIKQVLKNQVDIMKQLRINEKDGEIITKMLVDQKEV